MLLLLKMFCLPNENNFTNISLGDHDYFRVKEESI